MKAFWPNSWRQLVAFLLVTVAFVVGLRILDVQDNRQAEQGRQDLYLTALASCERINTLRRIVYVHLQESADLVNRVAPDEADYPKQQRAALNVMRSTRYRLPDGSIDCLAAIPKPR